MTRHQSEPQPDAETAASTTEVPETVNMQSGPTAPDANAEIEALRAENERLSAGLRESQERMVWMQAEFDNVRKRLRREADQAGNRALARFIKPLLTELDHFSHAIQAADPANFVAFAQGIVMIQTNLQGVLSGSGIEPIPCEGVFDPALHEVLAEEENAEVAKGTIVRVERQGWKLGDQVVRAAQVIVARPPAAPAAE